MYAILLAAAFVADNPEPKVTGTPPVFLVASVKGDTLTSIVNVAEMVPVTFTKKVNNNGQLVDVTITEYRTMMKQVTQSRDLAKVTITTAGGKKLTIDDLKKRLEKPSPIVISGDDKPVSETFLKLLDKDVVVLVFPVPQVQKR